MAGKVSKCLKGLLKKLRKLLQKLFGQSKKATAQTAALDRLLNKFAEQYGWREMVCGDPVR
jgi:hypothetical protein